MDSVISGVIGFIPQYVIEPIRTRFRIIRNLGRNYEGLEKAKETLVGRSKAEREKLEDIKKQTGADPSEDAERWFRQAHDAVTDADNLRTKYYLHRQNTRGTCSDWFCFLSRYRLSKEALHLKGRVDDLRGEDLKAGWTAASTSQKGKQLNTVSLEGQTSRDSLKDMIIKSVLDDSYVVVGLHGMGGIGKTTLLQHVHNHFTNTVNHFDSISFTTLSATPDFVKVQKQIARDFGLDLKDCTGDDDVKQKLSRQTGRYLLVLDDMWEPPVDINEICIPAPTKENGCKILMASRSSKVINKFVNQFAGVNDSLRAIRVGTLPPDEAWNLFVNKVGESLITSCSEIKLIAEDIVRKCDGLPLVIAVVGSTMSTRKTKREWKDALREMGQLSKANLEDIQDKVFELLKFSFDKLNSPEEKSLFLYCCIFTEDAYIQKYQLYTFGIGLYKFGNGEEALCDDEMLTLEAMRCKVDVLIGNLTNSSMLEDAGFGRVKVHDVLREFGLWVESPKIIAKEAGKVLTSEWSKASMVSLYSVESMSHQLSNDCPHLHTLMLSAAEESSNMSILQAHFLKHMPALKILDLGNFNGIQNLPPSVSHLVNLRSLSIRDCHSLKELPPEIGMLVQLISLDLNSCTSLRRLPVEMKELKKLRHLNINYTHSLKRITYVLLSGLRKLEEIEARGSALKLDNDNILELDQLPHLTLINQIRLWKVKVDSRLVNQLAKWSCGYLEFWNCDTDASALLDFRQFPLLSLDWLKFYSCKGLTRVPTHEHINALEVKCCQDLKTLVVVEEEKVDEMNNNIIVFQKLSYLELVELDGLETICSGRVPPQQPLGPGSSCLFSSLLHIRIERCHKLKVLFTSGVTPLLLNLRYLTVFDCSQLEYLLIEDNDNDDMESIVNAFPKLLDIWLGKLPELTVICTSNNTNNQHPMDLMKWPSLRRAYVYDCPKLKLRRPKLGKAQLIEDSPDMMILIKESEEERKQEEKELEEEFEEDNNLECMD